MMDGARLIQAWFVRADLALCRLGPWLAGALVALGIGLMCLGTKGMRNR